MDGIQKLLIYIRDAIGYGCVVSISTTTNKSLRLVVEWIALGTLIRFNLDLDGERIAKRDTHAAMIDEFIVQSKEGYEKEVDRIAREQRRTKWN